MGWILFFFLGFSSVFNVNFVTASPTVLVSCSKSSFAGRLACATEAFAAAWLLVPEGSDRVGTGTLPVAAVDALGAEISVGVMRVFLARLEGGASMVALCPGSQGGMGVDAMGGFEKDNAVGLVVDVAAASTLELFLF